MGRQPDRLEMVFHIKDNMQAIHLVCKRSIIVFTPKKQKNKKIIIASLGTGKCNTRTLIQLSNFPKEHAKLDFNL